MEQYDNYLTARVINTSCQCIHRLLKIMALSSVVLLSVPVNKSVWEQVTSESQASGLTNDMEASRPHSVSL